MRTRQLTLLVAASVVLAVLLCGARTLYAQDNVDYMFAPSWPRFSSPTKGGTFLTYRLQFLDANGKLTTAQIKFTIPGRQQNETVAQAQKRKAETMAATINNRGLNGVTAAAAQGNVPSIPDLVNGRWVLVPGYEVTVMGLAVTKTRRRPVASVGFDPTVQGVGGGILVPGNPQTPYEGSMRGSYQGLSSGTDLTGAPSVISFGFYSTDGLTIDIVSVVGTAGQSDSQILGQLADQFNLLYSDSGLTASYNALTDTLSFDQPLDPAQRVFFTANTDTGIPLDTYLHVSESEKAAAVVKHAE